MGQGPSRGISLRNPEPPGRIIQITEDVAKRMTAKYGQSPAAPASETKATSAAPGEYASQPPLPTPQQHQQQQGLFTVGHRGFPVVETVNAYEVRQQKEVEIKQNDEFWTSKLKDLEARYVAAAFAAEGVFNSELEKLDKLVPKMKEPVCQDHTLRVAKCYEANPNKALKCSEEVSAFARCVDAAIHKPPAGA